MALGGVTLGPAELSSMVGFKGVQIACVTIMGHPQEGENLYQAPLFNVKNKSEVHPTPKKQPPNHVVVVTWWTASLAFPPSVPLLMTSPTRG